MATAKLHRSLGRGLPPRLLRFFNRYPNRALYPETSAALTAAPNISPSDPNATSEDTIAKPPRNPNNINPFQPYRHPETGKWHNPVFSLRRQAELVKLAQQHGVEELLPYTKKSTQERLRRREEQGLRVKGTGVGQKVKGKVWERTLKGRLEKRRQAMLEMPKMIVQWKEVSFNSFQVAQGLLMVE